MILVALAALLSISGVAYYLPQLVRLARSGTAAGLSPVGQVIGSVDFILWIAFLAARDDWALLAPTSIGAAVWIGVTVLTVRRLPSPRWLAPVAVAWGLGLAALVPIGGWTLLGTVLAFTGIVAYAPCAMDAIRARDVSDLSPLAWAICTFDETGWLVYGLIDHDPVITLYGLLAVPGPLIVTIRALTGPRGGAGSETRTADLTLSDAA